MATGPSALSPSGTGSPVRQENRSGRRVSYGNRCGRRVSYGRQPSGRLPEEAEADPAFTVGGISSDGSQIGSGGTGTGGEKSCWSGLKYVGSMTDDSRSEEVIEIYLGSFHQQALISEAKRVLSQPQNRGLGMELVAGVAAMGVGRNSIGAIVTTSRPYKKVRPSHGRLFPCRNECRHATLLSRLSCEQRFQSLPPNSSCFIGDEELLWYIQPVVV